MMCRGETPALLSSTERPLNCDAREGLCRFLKPCCASQASGMPAARPAPAPARKLRRLMPRPLPAASESMTRSPEANLWEKSGMDCNRQDDKVQSTGAAPSGRRHELLLQRNGLGGLVIGEEIAKAGPADERFEDFFVVLVRHAHDDGLKQDVLIHRALALQDLVDFSEEPQFEELPAPEHLPLLRAGPHETLARRVENDHALGRIDKIEHFSGFHDIDDAAELLGRVAGHAKAILLAAAGFQIFHQAHDFSRSCL